MTTSIWNRARTQLLRPLPPERFGLYVALVSCLLAVVALFYAVRIFELQRRDALLFLLDDRYQAYERLLISSECVYQQAPDLAMNTAALDALRGVQARVRTSLLRKRQATLRELVDVRDVVLTDGTDAAVALTRHRLSMNLTEGIHAERVANVMARCAF